VRRRGILISFAVVLTSVGAVNAIAQNDPGGIEVGSCTLRERVYSCDSAAFRPILQRAATVGISVHNSDGAALAQLTTFVTRKLGKTVSADGAVPDLIFLLIPIEPSGVTFSTGAEMLGTLRVYSVAADGGRGHLLWAETFSGDADVPWPAVVRGLILQFEGHFKIR
jgi:hypothetical protein